MRLELGIVSASHLPSYKQRTTVDTYHLSMNVCSRSCSAVFGPTRCRARQSVAELIYARTQKVPRYS
jgi:hypothetical protein